jgi:hypothetical protein
MCSQNSGANSRIARYLGPVLFILVTALLASPQAILAAQNPVQTENALAGTTAWQLTNPATNHEIEGYASLTSVNAGSQLSFFVNATDPTYTINIYRMGWYGGQGGRLLMGPIQQAGVKQLMPVPDPTTGLIECNWTSPYAFTVPSTWVSGIYLAQLTGSSGKQSYIIFAVRQDSRASTYLYQSSVTTYQAYNNWGGKSLYSFNSSGGTPAVKVSYNRPYGLGQQPAGYYGVGAGEFITAFQPATEVVPGAWEINMVRFLEKNGFDVAYSTDIDAHESASMLLNHKVWMSVGHDEYWSMQMRNNVIAARDAGVSLTFFTSNACYWQIRFESSPITGAVDRTQVCYKSSADPVTNNTQTIRWRDLQMPEDIFIGVQYQIDPVAGNIQISNASLWPFFGTGLQNGNILQGLLGYEVDSVDSGSPSNTIVLAHSPFQINGGTRFSDMAMYTAASGASVFATGSMQWNWGLDDYNAPAARPSNLSTAAQQITLNILNNFAFPVAVSPASATLAGGQTQQFTATILGTAGTVNWSLNPAMGSISASGFYTAPSIINGPQTVTVTATNPSNSAQSGTATVTLLSTVAITTAPATASLTSGQTQQFTATVTGASNSAVTWSLNPSVGTISNTGLYTAPSNFTTSQTISVIATSVSDPAKSAASSVSLVAPVVVQLSPASTTLSALQTQQFTATVTGPQNTSVTWSLTPSMGTVSTSGLYTAPSVISSNQTVTIKATSVADSTKSASSAISLVSGAGTYAVARVNAGGAAYTDSLGQAWSADSGFSGGSTFSTSKSIANTSDAKLYQSLRYGSSFGYTFSVPNGTYTVNLRFAEVYFTTSGQRAFNVAINGTPVLTNFDIVAAAGGGFAAIDRPFSLTVAGGQISIQFTSGTADLPQINAIEIIPGGVAVQVNPTSASLTAAQTQQFTASVTGSANTAVNWSLNPALGTISTSGLYTAPATVTGNPSVTVTATSAADPAKSAAATVSLSPGVTIQLSPTSVNLSVSQTQQFIATVGGTSNTAVNWTMNLSVGTLSTTGLYTAPSAINSAQAVTVTATSGADPSKTATATVNLTPVAVQMNPTTATLSASQTQQFTATVTGSSNTAVNWSLNPSVGTISTSGLYTAPSTISSTQTVTVTATSAADPTKSATGTVTLTPVAVQVSPTTASLFASQTQQFNATVTGSANTAVNWSLNPAVGTVSGTGLYTAPSTISSTQTVNVIATSAADSSKSAAATVTLNPASTGFAPIRINAGGTAYTDNLGQAWAADSGFSGGSTFSTSSAIANTAAAPLYQRIRYGNGLTYQFTVPNGAYTVNLKFAEIYYTTSGKRIFNVAINGSTVLTNFDIVAQAGGGFAAVDKSFSATVAGGQISILFTAGSADLPQINAIEIVGTNIGVQVSPGTASLTAGQTQQFNATVTGSANTAVNWSLNPAVGAISTSGLYTAPSPIGASQTVSVIATSVVDPTKSASATVTLTPVTVQVSPATASLSASQTQQFSATVTGSSNTSVNWSLTPAVGTISSTGLYTAPSTISATQTVTVTATSAADSTKSAIATVTLTPVAVQVSPTTASLFASQTQQFSATVTGSSNTAVSWSLNPSVGTISSTGLYTAPSTISATQTVTVTATSAADATKSASATVTLKPVSFTPIRINAGGPAYTDSLGQVWAADSGFSGGSTFSTSTAIANTSTAPLYQRIRYGGGLTYQFTVPNGAYTLNLKFAEIYFTATGKRIFNVAINGSTVLTNFDIVAQAGAGFRAVDKSFNVTVTGGTITIQFTNGSADLPQINAIEILSAGS